MNRCILLPHSLNPGSLSKEGWEHVVWGKPENGIFGRHSYALRMFLQLHLQEKTPHIYLGNGSYVAPDGRSEAEYTRDFILARAIEVDPIFARTDFLASHIHLERVRGQNTRGEIESCLQLCTDRSFDEVVLITSPFHAPRSYRDGLVVKKALALSVRIMAEASDTDPSNCGPEQVVIREPKFGL